MSFTIPTYFTAIDQLTRPVGGMSTAVETFGRKAEHALDRGERAFRKMTPALNETQKQMMSMIGTAAIVGAAFAGAAFSVKSIMDYETELANLKSITGATKEEFDVFKGKIKEVSIDTKMSSVEVVKAFTAIANNQPELLKSADALSMVTKSSIILAQASKMELQPAGEALTQILNQYGKSAADAATTINTLAAGSVAGSSEIRDTADAIQKFGTVAANAGIKINESVALIELASKFEKGAEAGSKLRNILIMMSTAKVQDPKAVADMKRLGVNMDTVADKTLPLSTRLKEMAKVAKDDAALFHIFGKENQAMATGILSSAGNLDTMLEAFEKNKNMAQEMADTNNLTLAVSIERLKAKWVTMITTSDGATTGLSAFNTVTQWLTRNLDTVLTVTVSVIGAFAAWWAIMKVARIAMLAYNIGLGIYNALTGTSTVYTAAQTVASTSQTIATGAMTAAQWALNVAMEANPIGIIIAALVALAAAIYAVWKHYQMLEEVYQKSAAGAKHTAIEKETAAVKNLSKAYQEKGMSKEASDKQATADRVANLQKTQVVLAGKVQEDFKQMIGARGGMFGGVISLLTGDQETKRFNESRGALAAATGAKNAIDLNGQRANNTASTVTNNINKKLTIDFKNMPKGVDVSGDTGANDVTPSTTSTMK